MEERVFENLVRAFVQESRARARSLAFAYRARKEGNQAAERLFRAVAEAKAVQARRFLGHLRGKIGSTQENIREALEMEKDLLRESYPQMSKDAQGAAWAVLKAFRHTEQVSKVHLELYESISSGLGPEGALYVCRICGYIAQGECPDSCPICHAVKGRFSQVL